MSAVAFGSEATSNFPGVKQTVTREFGAEPSRYDVQVPETFDDARDRAGISAELRAACSISGSDAFQNGVYGPKRDSEYASGDGHPAGRPPPP
jgi:hypothetical protein